MALNVLSSAQTLEHPTRRRIYRHLLMLPGDHFRSIVRSLNLGHGTASHHLDVLMRNGLIVIDKARGRCRYYPKGEESELERNQLFVRHWNYRDLRVRILFAVERVPNLRAGEIARQLGVSRQLIAYHLFRLQELGLVQREYGRYRARGSRSPGR